MFLQGSCNPIPLPASAPAGAPLGRCFLRAFTATAVLLFILILSTAPLAAQYTTGSLGGTVTDPSGSAVVAARVVVLNKDTGLTRSTESGTDGGFLFSALPGGTYRVTAAKEGFSTYVQDGVVISVNQSASVSIGLKVGTTTDAITVTANAELVNTRSAAEVQLMDQKSILNLPLEGRQVQSLVYLAAGTVDTTWMNCGVGCHGGVYPGEQFVSASGTGSGQVSYQLDGAPHNDTYIQINLPFPNPDAVQEFTLNRENMSAEFGQAAGGVVNIVSKSGTNQFHGSAFEFLRNGAMNARNFFAPEQDTLKRNQFGGSFGGPIKKDKLFFFGTYQGTRIRSAAQGNISQVPTQAERNGDFSDLPVQLHDPLTGEAFPNNQIPTSRFSPPAVYFLEHIPVPNGPGHQLTYMGPRIAQHEDQWMPKIDYLTSRHQISGRYYWTNFSQPPFINRENILATDSNGNRVRVQNIGINETFTATPHLLFNSWFGLARQKGGSLSGAPFGFPDAGIKVAAPETPELDLTVANYFGVSTNHWGDFDRGEWTARENVTWMKGSHELKFGGELLHMKKNLINTYLQSGNFRFRTARSGDNLSDFFLGTPTRWRQHGGEYSTLHGWGVSAYLQDNWRASRRLTVQMGLRWDPFLPYVEELGKTVCFGPGQQSRRYPNAPEGLLYGGDNPDPGCPASGMEGRYSHIGPRAGLAYRLTEDGKTSLRGGFGYYYSIVATADFNSMVNVAPFSPGYIFYDVDFQDPWGSIGWQNPFPAQFGPKAPGPEAEFSTPTSISFFSKDFQPPNFGTWSVTLERQFASDWLLKAAYVGNKGTHLGSSREFNPAVYGPGATSDNIQERRPYQDFSTVGEGTSSSNSHYHALQLTMEKRFGAGLSVMGNYTFSRRRDDLGWTNPFDRRFNYGLADDDIAHNFKLANVWEIPSGGLTGVASRVLGGWQLNSIWTWRSGFPFSIYSGNDNALSGGGGDRADIVAPGSAQLDYGRSHAAMAQQWFDVSKFGQNATGTFGNSERNLLRGPRAFNIDLGIVKNIGMTESSSVQFRAEAFNALNNVNFGMPDTTQSSGTFGQIFGANSGRILQLGLKVLF